MSDNIVERLLGFKKDLEMSKKTEVEWTELKRCHQNGHVFFTNDGSAKWEDGRWYLCTLEGSIPSCADWGCEVSEVEPTHYLPVSQMWPSKATQ